MGNFKHIRVAHDDSGYSFMHLRVALIVLYIEARFLPLAFYGAENYGDNLVYLKRSDFHIWVELLYHLDTRNGKVTRAVRKRML